MAYHQEHMAWHKQANETPLVVNQDSTEMPLSAEVRQTTKQTYTHQV
jgi:hypothetical protein